MHTQYAFLLSVMTAFHQFQFINTGGLKPCIFGDFYYFRRGPGDPDRLLKNVLTF
jgi:hypothetical protein